MKVTKLLNLTAAALLVTVLVFAGCSKTDSLTGPNANGQVSFQIQQQNGVNGGIDFLFKPSVDVKITRIIAKYEAQPFRDTLTLPNPNYVFSKDTLYYVNEYTGVQAGQQWKFEFSGSLNNSNYNVSSDYTVQ